MFDAVLIANRGEIAVRIARACRELGVRSVGVYSEVDRGAAHTRACDEARPIGPAEPASSYLSAERLIEAACTAGVDAVHPGYGFLAEDARFARAVADAGLTFIGPSPEAIERMGDKLSARDVARAAGVAIVPGTTEPTDDPEVALAFAEEHGYPVAVKAMFGGGGRGMKVVDGPEAMRDALAAARREAELSFGRAECYLERYLESPRHLEVQVLGDLDGTVIHLGERDCSLQRRHQKLVEEAPAPGLAPEVRIALTDAALAVAREMRYTNAGTCEFLLAEDGRSIHFLEMNTRLQVEHPVTELVTGIDLVHAQLRIASGDGMGLTQDDVDLRGHAIEVRINAEDPGRAFAPTPGTVARYEPPLGPGVRLDSAIVAGGSVPREYDSMLAKLVVHAEDRDLARARMLRALDELVLEGLPTTVPFHRLAMTQPDFAAGTHSTASVEHDWDLTALAPAEAPEASPPTARLREVTVEVEGRRYEVRVVEPAPPRVAGRTRRATRSTRQDDDGAVLAPMQGTVVAHAVAVGVRVRRGDLLVVLEAMKMENPVVAPRDGVVRSITAEVGASIELGAVLAELGPDAGAEG